MGDTILGTDGANPIYAHQNAAGQINLMDELALFMNAHQHSSGGHDGAGGHAPLAAPTSGGAQAASIMWFSARL